MGQRITKRTVDALKAGEREFTVWDDAVYRLWPSRAAQWCHVLRGRL